MRGDKEFSSFDVAAIVRELESRVLDSRTDNIYQLKRKTLLLKLPKRANQRIMSNAAGNHALPWSE